MAGGGDGRQRESDHVKDPRSRRRFLRRLKNHAVGYNRGMRSKGFIALTELIVVLGVITILLGVTMPSVWQARRKGGEARVLAEASSVIVPAMHQFRGDLGYFPNPNTGSPADGYGLLSKAPLPAADQPLWRGPYLDRWPSDPWGNPYELRGDGVNCLYVMSPGYSRNWDHWPPGSADNCSTINATQAAQLDKTGTTAVDPANHVYDAGIPVISR